MHGSFFLGHGGFAAGAGGEASRNSWQENGDFESGICIPDQDYRDEAIDGRDIRPVKFPVKINFCNYNRKQEATNMKKFLEYWAAGPRTNQQIDGKVLYDEYEARLADLENTRRKTNALLVPLNVGKGVHPAFDPDQTDAVVALAAEIEAENDTVKSISQAINDFMALVGGPSLAPLEAKYLKTDRTLKRLIITAKNVAAVAARKNPQMDPTDVLDLPEVLAANAALAEAREGLEAEIADSIDRLQKARVILEHRPARPIVSRTEAERAAVES